MAQVLKWWDLDNRGIQCLLIVVEDQDSFQVLALYEFRHRQLPLRRRFPVASSLQLNQVVPAAIASKLPQEVRSTYPSTSER